MLALTSCSTFMYCLMHMIGELAMVRIHGTVESILFALAISMAAAEKGEGNSRLGCGCAGVVLFVISPLAGSRAGVISGLLKHKRYSAMKKSSLRAQHVKSTHWSSSV